MTKTKSQKARAKEEKQKAVTTKKKAAGGGKKRQFLGFLPDNFEVSYKTSENSHGKRQGQAVAKVPAATGTRITTKAPKITTGKGSQRVQHTEFLADWPGTLGGSGINDFICQLPVNPGLAEVFPWLSGIARNYESYTFKLLRFRYVSAVGTDTPGDIVIAANYDSSTAPPTNKAEMVNMEGAQRSNVWMSTECVIRGRDADTLGKRRYIRTGNVEGDIKTYDFLAIVLGHFGTGTATSLGEIHIDYDVEFYTPTPATSEPGAFYWASISSTTGATRTSPMGDAPSITSTMPISDDELVRSGQLLNLPPGSWNITLMGVVSTTASGALMVPSYGTGATERSSFQSTANGIEANMQVLGVFIVDCTSSNINLNSMALIYSTPEVNGVSVFTVEIFPVPKIPPALKGIYQVVPKPSETRLGRALTRSIKNIAAPGKLVPQKVPQPSSSKPIRPQLEECLFCHDPEPDHIGRDCPARTALKISALPKRSGSTPAQRT